MYICITIFRETNSNCKCEFLPLSFSGRLSVMLSSTSKTRSGRLPVQYKGNVFHFFFFFQFIKFRRDIDVFPPKKGDGKRKGGVGKKEKSSGNGMRVQKVSSYSHCIRECKSWTFPLEFLRQNYEGLCGLKV
ncbi:hypothetical protein MKW92_012820 [Papaver armeniacum]|nr:hypothetical protein MKW92_012820 [Papaver armeniacum]